MTHIARRLDSHRQRELKHPILQNRRLRQIEGGPGCFLAGDLSAETKPLSGAPTVPEREPVANARRFTE